MFALNGKRGGKRQTGARHRSVLQEFKRAGFLRLWPWKHLCRGHSRAAPAAPQPYQAPCESSCGASRIRFNSALVRGLEWPKRRRSRKRVWGNVRKRMYKRRLLHVLLIRLTPYSRAASSGIAGRLVLYFDHRRRGFLRLACSAAAPRRLMPPLASPCPFPEPYWNGCA